MEKKILHTFRVLNSLFSEARFVYDKPGAVPPAEAGKPDDKGEKKEEKKPDIDEKKTKVKETAESKREREKAEVEAKKKRDELKNKIVQLPPAPSEKQLEEFMKVDAAEQAEGLDWMRMNRLRTDNKINAQIWDHSTEEGLQKILTDFKALGIIGGKGVNSEKNNVYYENMIGILNGAADLSKSDKSLAADFKAPADGVIREKVEGLEAKGSFLGGPAYIQAFRAMNMVRARLMVQDKIEVDTHGAQSKQGVDSIGTTITDAVKSNISVLQKAAKDRDYATLGIYAVGAYALWKTVGSKLFGGGDGHGAGGEHGGHGGIDWKNWLLIGAAVYGADKVLKNAGYDVLKMAGFKDMNAEVKGTPMESLERILAQYNNDHPDEKNDFKNLDSGIVMTMSGVKIKALEKLKSEAKNPGGFIHPREFPDLFPNLKSAWPFKKSTGVDKPDGADEREYARVGRQLYQLALALPIVYQETLFKNHAEYKGVTYANMLTDPVRGELEVWQLMEATEKYAPAGDMGGLLNSKKPTEVEEKMKNGTAKVLTENGFHLDVTELKPGTGHIAGSLKGFPIVVIATKEGYRVYLQNEYSNKQGYNAVPTGKYTTIPLSGASMEREAQEAVKKVDKRMEELLNVLQGKEKQLGKPRFENGQWKCDLKLSDSDEAKEFGIEATDVTGVIEVGPAGDGVTLKLDKAHGGASINVKEGLKDQHPLLFTLIPKLVNQAEFHALRVFSNTDRLSLSKDKNAPKGVFTLLIGKNKQISAEIEYKNGRFEFKDTAKQAEMLKKGSGFKEELKSALGEDERMAEATKNWEKAIAAAPSSYLMNFIKHVPDVFTGATLDKPWAGLKLDAVDGSVARNYALSLIEAQKGLILAKVANGIDGANSLADVDTKIGQIFTPAIQDLDNLSDHFVELTTQHENANKNFSEEEFNETVLYKIAEIGIQSNDYKTWYAQFTNELFLRYGMNNLRNGNAKKARDVAKVFAYYTAVLDDPKMDGANLSLSITAETEDYIQRIHTAKNDLARSGIANPNDAAIATKVNASLTLTPTSNPLHLADLRTADVSAMLNTEKDLDKARKYRANAKYAEYVSHQIYAKFNDVDAKSIAPAPEDHGFWKIDDYSTWAPNHTQALHEFIDKNPRIKMNKELKTLSEYFDMTPAQRLAFKGDVILPRDTKPEDSDKPQSNYQFVIRLKDDGSGPVPEDVDKAQVLQKLLVEKSDSKGVISEDSFEYTAAETMFRQKMNKVLNKIDHEYGNGPGGKNLLTDRFAELKHMFNYSATTATNLSTDSAGKKILVYDFNLDRTFLTDAVSGKVLGTPQDKQLVAEMKKFNDAFDLASANTITKSNQEAYMNQQVENFINNIVLSDYGKSTYFKTEDGLLTRVGHAAKQIALDIKDWFI